MPNDPPEFDARVRFKEVPEQSPLSPRYLTVHSPSIERIAFPEFDPGQLNEIAELADLVKFDTGDELISHGQKNYPFYVIKSGTIRIVERDGDQEMQIATNGPGNFSGDVIDEIEAR